MRKGGQKIQTSLGFTIVEVLIVLAVTSVLFVTATIFISDRQAKTEFQVGAQQIQQQFRQVISDAENGFYPTNTTLQCRVVSGSVSIVETGGEQGSNSDCIFVGKIIVLGGGDNTVYKVFSLAGKRTVASGGGVANSRTIIEAEPVAIAPVDDTYNGMRHAPDLTSTVQLPTGFTFVWAEASSITVADTILRTEIDPADQYFNTAIMSDLTKETIGGNTGSGSQTFSLRSMKNWTNPSWPATSDTKAQAKRINDEVTTAGAAYVELVKAQYCFQSESTGQAVLITITGGMQVTSEIKGSKCGM